MLNTASAVFSWMRSTTFGIAALGLASCIVEDGNKACGKDQVKVDGPGILHCECAPGYVIDTSTGLDCKPCGENEEAAGGECVCKEGYTRPSAAASCSKSALGNACDEDMPCSGDVPICADGYCTSECETSLDCERAWVCEEQDARHVCKKPPEGYGKACESSADCEGTEATYCEAFQSKTCIVTCSETSPCPGDWACCNITVASLVICVSPANLTDGACPAGGQLVTP